jgi:hypothetical protein
VHEGRRCLGAAAERVAGQPAPTRFDDSRRVRVADTGESGALNARDITLHLGQNQMEFSV